MARPPRSGDILSLLRGLGQVGAAIVNIKKQEISFKVATSSLKPLAAQSIAKLQENLNTNDRSSNQTDVSRIASEALERLSVLSEGIKAYTMGTTGSSKTPDVYNSEYDPLFDPSLLELNPEDLHLEALGVPQNISFIDTTSEMGISKGIEKLQQIETVVDKSRAELGERMEAFESLMNIEGIEKKEITEEELDSINEKLLEISNLAFGHDLKIFNEVEYSKPLEEVLENVIEEQEIIRGNDLQNNKLDILNKESEQALQNNVSEKYVKIESNVENTTSANEASKESSTSDSSVEISTDKTKNLSSFSSTESPKIDETDAVISAAAVSAAVAATQIIAAGAGVSAAASVAAITAAAAVSGAAASKLAPYLKRQDEDDKHVQIEDALEVLQEATDPSKKTLESEPVTVSADGSLETTVSNGACDAKSKEEIITAPESINSTEDRPDEVNLSLKTAALPNETSESITNISDGLHETELSLNSNETISEHENDTSSKSVINTESESFESSIPLKSSETTHSGETNPTVSSVFDAIDRSPEEIFPKESIETTTESMKPIEILVANDPIEEKIILPVTNSAPLIPSEEASSHTYETKNEIDTFISDSTSSKQVKSDDSNKSNEFLNESDVKIVSIEETEVLKEETEAVDSIEAKTYIKDNITEILEESDIKIVSVEETEVLKEEAEAKDTIEAKKNIKENISEILEESDIKIVSIEETEVLKEKTETTDSIEAKNNIKDNITEILEESDVKIVSIEATEVLKEETEATDSIEAKNNNKDNITEILDESDVKIVTLEESDALMNSTVPIDLKVSKEAEVIKNNAIEILEESDVKVISGEEAEVIIEKSAKEIDTAELVETDNLETEKFIGHTKSNEIKEMTKNEYIAPKKSGNSTENIITSEVSVDANALTFESSITEKSIESTTLVKENLSTKKISEEYTEMEEKTIEVISPVIEVETESIKASEIPIEARTAIVSEVDTQDIYVKPQVEEGIKVISDSKTIINAEPESPESKESSDTTGLLSNVTKSDLASASVVAGTSAAVTTAGLKYVNESVATTTPATASVKAPIAKSLSKPKLLGKKPLAKGKPKSTLSDNAKARKVPYSRLGRMMTFGGLAAGIGAGTIAELTRRSLGMKGNDKTGSLLGDSAVLSEANAKRIVDTLCKVRGAALKLGQMMSIQDNALINPQLQKIFDRVRQSADFMPPYQLEKVLIDEFGSDWRSIVSTFDERPFAAASIGQVHLATLEDGRSVAMKIQYPGVADGIESDINNLMATMKLANILPEGLYVDEVIDVAKKELAGECDYYREAEYTERFRNHVIPYPEYYVPEVLKDLCSKQVFTTELIDGVAVDKCVDMDQDTRNYISELMLRLCLLELFKFGFMQTDPNWSNFFYNAETQQMALLDFGACREYRKAFVDDYIEVIHGAATNDRDKVLHYSRLLGFLTGHEAKVMETAHVDSVMILGEAFRCDGPFSFGEQDITRRIQAQVPIMLTHRMCPPPEESYSLHRKMSGVFLLVARLNGLVNCKPIFDEIYNSYRSGGTWEDFHNNRL